MKRVVIAMSGGVDSSVAAALLVEQGYDVVGMMLRLWSEPAREDSNRCCTPDSMALARRIAARLGIPFYAVDARDVFHTTVVQSFIDGYTKGITPNPCLVCNREIRWKFLLNQAMALGADYLATGHYARVQESFPGAFTLLRSVDRQKDQSYVLHVLEQRHLARALFPVGEYHKGEIREMAAKFGLPVAERPDSQDLCFLAGDDYRDFLSRNSPAAPKPGPILNRDGIYLGEHRGLAFYTIGQRKGLGITAPTPYYVQAKDTNLNALIVCRQEELGHNVLYAHSVNWISANPPQAPIRLQVKIRYKAEDAWATLSPLAGERIEADFDIPLRDITPGQAAVFYQDDVCLGGGLIE
jgi:tRNA-uridine 2-sulfurtransferase